MTLICILRKIVKVKNFNKNMPVEHQVYLSIHCAGSSYRSIHQNWKFCPVILHVNPKINLKWQHRKIREANEQMQHWPIQWLQTLHLHTETYWVRKSRGDVFFSLKKDILEADLSCPALMIFCLFQLHAQHCLNPSKTLAQLFKSNWNIHQENTVDRVSYGKIESFKLLKKINII